MEELYQTQAASKEKALRSQVVYTAYMMYHGASGNFIDCQAAVFPQLFDDSKLTKIWDIRCIELIGFKYFLILIFFKENQSFLFCNSWDLSFLSWKTVEVG